jgi:hypothetical protein
LSAPRGPCGLPFGFHLFAPGGPALIAFRGSQLPDVALGRGVKALVGSLIALALIGAAVSEACTAQFGPL